ncbi:MAG: hypothetical protein KBC48_01100 [Candidatus Pacebacteria bacterium]|nr:hypothetical protein [Candidatus Paceibacterota bacterium]
MAIRQGRRSDEYGPLWRLFTVIMLVLVALLSHSVWQVWGKNQASREVRAEAEANLATVAARHDKLKVRVERLETPRGKEEEIRNNFPVAREGEQVVIIFDEEERATTTMEKEEGWWEKFWNKD